MNPEIERELYTEITRRTNVTVISIAHRMALAQYHDLRLTIVGDGSGQWHVEQLEKR